MLRLIFSAVVGRTITAIAVLGVMLSTSACEPVRTTTEIRQSRQESEPEMVSPGEMESPGEMVSPG